MATSRIEILKQLLEQDPSSVFSRYGLAMEYVKASEFDRAMEEFAILLAKDPAYGAAYFHGAQTLEKMGKIDEARDYYRRGIANTRDAHARAEMQGALDILGD